ncbi:hypothetical protein [Flavobacterium sp.]|uniref:hypothetical protein n=1 Tax=Flavobacterium sp. TaxID=239 RepID=UPI002636EB55|nr:hypothetical protein [Flavobacterium sp.]
MRLAVSLFGLLFGFQSVTAQIEPEHIYESLHVKRFKLPSNEGRYAHLNENGALLIFDDTHQLINTTALTYNTVGNSTDYILLAAGTTIFDEDPDIEVAVLHKNNALGVPLGTYVFDDNGDVLHFFNTEARLLDIDNFTYFITSSNGTATVFDATTFSSLGTINGYYGSLKTSTSGTKICAFNSSTNAIELFNSDLSLWKSIPIANANLSTTRPSAIATLDMSANSEVILSIDNKILSENGNVAFEGPVGTTTKVYNFENQAALFVVNSYETGTASGKVYNFADLQLLQEFAHPIFLSTTNSSNPNIIQLGSLNNLNTKVYNFSGELLQTHIIPENPLINDNPNLLESISDQSVLNNGNGYYYAAIKEQSVGMGSGYSYTGIVQNQDGNTVINQENIGFWELSSIEGLEHKIIGITNYTTLAFPELNGKTYVYDFTTLNTNEIFENQLNIYPNPTADLLNISNWES